MNRCYSGTANANTATPVGGPGILGKNPSVQAPYPTGTAMNCRPSTVYVLGFEWWPLPQVYCQSSSPLLALNPR